jgi:hypothetical protein
MVCNIAQSDHSGKGSISKSFQVFCLQRDGMISDYSEARDQNLRPIRGGSSTEPHERVLSTLKEIHNLLELYAPAWYSEELYTETVAALRALGSNNRSSQKKTRPRTCRVSGRVPSNSGSGLL